MDIRPTESQLQSAQRRPQKYMGFTLRPEDEKLLDLLPASQKEILLAKGRYQDLAAHFGVAVGTVRSRLHRARAALSALRRNSGEAEDPVPLRNDVIN